jgi:hypothetical protein
MQQNLSILRATKKDLQFLQNTATAYFAASRVPNLTRTSKLKTVF